MDKMKFNAELPGIVKNDFPIFNKELLDKIKEEGRLGMRAFKDSEGKINIDSMGVVDSDLDESFRNIWSPPESPFMFPQLLRRGINWNRKRVQAVGQPWNRKKKRVAMSMKERQEKSFRRVMRIMREFPISVNKVLNGNYSRNKPTPIGVGRGLTKPILFSDRPLFQVTPHSKKALEEGKVTIVRNKNREHSEDVKKYYFAYFNKPVDLE